MMSIRSFFNKLLQYPKTLFLLFIGATLYYAFLTATHMHSETSPCGNYSISVYIKPTFFAMPGGGGSGSQLTQVVLKNSWGWTIGVSTEECAIFYNEIEISWDYDNNEVYFGKARAIDLNTGQCDC